MLYPPLTWDLNWADGWDGNILKGYSVGNWSQFL
jgi:hypothetical protein